MAPFLFFYSVSAASPRMEKYCQLPLLRLENHHRQPVLSITRIFKQFYGPKYL